MEAIPKEIVAGAVRDAIRLGAIGFDAVKQIVLSRKRCNFSPALTLFLVAMSRQLSSASSTEIQEHVFRIISV
jgi:hypothetical protein